MESSRLSPSSSSSSLSSTESSFSSSQTSLTTSSRSSSEISSQASSQSPEQHQKDGKVLIPQDENHQSLPATSLPNTNMHNRNTPISSKVAEKNSAIYGRHTLLNSSKGEAVTADTAISTTTTTTIITGSNNRAANNTFTHIRLNPMLRFERPDNEYIPLPPMKDLQNVSNALRRLLLDRDRYPEGKYRLLDYFRAAVEMFIEQVRVEFKQQFQMAQRNGRTMTRFTWKNNGELAICFACCCDMLKLLYDAVMPGPFKPLWDAFVQQLFPLLISESKVPGNILTTQTYHIKYMDWQKGGTRYGGEQTFANVRFPSVQERQVKVESYLRTGTGYRIEATPVTTSHSISTLRAAMSSQSNKNSASYSVTGNMSNGTEPASVFPSSTAENATVLPRNSSQAVTSALSLTGYVNNNNNNNNNYSIIDKRISEKSMNVSNTSQPYTSQSNAHATNADLTGNQSIANSLSHVNHVNSTLTIRPPTRAAVKGILAPQLKTSSSTQLFNVTSQISNAVPSSPSHNITQTSSSSSSSAFSPPFPSSMSTSSVTPLWQQQQQQQQVPLPPRPLPPEMKHVYWLSTLSHIKGSETHEAFPDYRIEYLPAFMRLCEATEAAEQMRIVMDVISTASESVQLVFEKLGGVIAIRRFVSQLITMHDASTLMYVVDKLARFDLPTWGTTTQQAWKTNLNQRLTGDLNWLRIVSSIPTERREAWNTIIVLLEQRYIFCEPRAEGAIATGKRKREKSSTTSIAVLSQQANSEAKVRAKAVDAILNTLVVDAFDISKWKLPRINTFFAKRIPIELYSSIADDNEENNKKISTEQLLERKHNVLEQVQKEWEYNIRTELQKRDVDLKSIVVPVWYDPYELLGMSLPLTPYKDN